MGGISPRAVPVSSSVALVLHEALEARGIVHRPSSCLIPEHQNTCAPCKKELPLPGRGNPRFRRNCPPQSLIIMHCSGRRAKQPITFPFRSFFPHVFQEPSTSRTLGNKPHGWKCTCTESQAITIPTCGKCRWRRQPSWIAFLDLICRERKPAPERCRPLHA